MEKGGLAQTHHQRIGQWGEAVAAYYLEQHGYQVLARNVRTARGELDLIARQMGGLVVFVEVKTRTNGGFGLPESAVDARKLEHLYQSAQVYLQEHAEYAECEWRIDVIAIQGKPGERVEDVGIEHFENISA